MEEDGNPAEDKQKTHHTSGHVNQQAIDDTSDDNQPSQGHQQGYMDVQQEEEGQHIGENLINEQIPGTNNPDVKPKDWRGLRSETCSGGSTPHENVEFRISSGSSLDTDVNVTSAEQNTADYYENPTITAQETNDMMDNASTQDVSSAHATDERHDRENVTPFSRSQSVGDIVNNDEHTRPNYRTMHSQTEVEVMSRHNEDYLRPEGTQGDYPYGYMPGMDVEITHNETGVAAQRLPEGLRHVMLHVVGSRPSEEIKFRRLKYRLEAEGQPYFNDNPFVPRATRSQRPHAIIRQQSKRPLLNRQRSHDPGSVSGSIVSSRDQSYASISRPETPHPPDGTEIPTVLVESGDQDKPVPTGLRNSTSRQKGVLVVLAINDLMASMALSILAPFFPKEARQKGISDATSGWVFGVFALVQCLTSPIFGKVLPRVGAKFLCQAGQFFAGGCTVLFGMLQYVSTDDNSYLFIVYCFVLRMFMAVGCAATGTAAFAIAARTFPDNPATVFGLLETAVGFGLMLGPAIGGVLYEVGGFVAPFAAIGIAMILIVPVGVCILPKDVHEVVLDSEDNISVREFLKVPAVAITAMAAFIACMAWVMPDPTLEPHLSKFNLSPTIIGLVFLLMAACYAICSPVWGWVADNVDDSAPMMVVGFTGTGIGFLALGPSPIFPLPADFAPLWLDIVALIVIGLSISLALVPTYDKILDAAEKAGIQDTLSNCGTVAGLWNASYCFGEFVGPVLAGWMMGKVGFAWTMSVASALCFLMALTMLILYLYESKFGPTGVRTPSSGSVTDNHTADERTPLLGSIRA